MRLQRNWFRSSGTSQWPRRQRYWLVVRVSASELELAPEPKLEAVREESV